MKPVSDMPKDLDSAAKKKWQELIGSVDPDADSEILANYCRQHSSLLAIRRERWKLHRSGKFQTMVPARDGTMGLNPMLTAENRLIASLNRMLKGLGLTSSREKAGVKRPPASNSAMDTLEKVLCGLSAWNPQTKNFEDCPQIEPTKRLM
jgi:phage terminase small subunit